MTQISDLFTHFMNLVNLKYYNKEESDSKYLEDLEINIESDGKLYIIDTLQNSLILASNSTNVSKGDTITLTATVKDKENRGIGHIPIRFYDDDVLIGTGITQNNGSTSINYTFTDEGEYEFRCETRKKTSNNIEIEIIKPNQIRLKMRFDDNSWYSEDEYGDNDGYFTTVSGLMGDDYQIDWGDGTITSFANDGYDGLSHYYINKGEYDIIVTSNPTYQSEHTLRDENIISLDYSDCSSLTRIESECVCASNLTQIILPPNLTSIGYYFLEDCKNLESIVFTSSTPPLAEDEYTFDSDVPTSCVIYVPQGTLSAYTSASNYPNPNTYTYTEYTSLNDINGGN